MKVKMTDSTPTSESQDQDSDANSGQTQSNATSSDANQGGDNPSRTTDKPSSNGASSDALITIDGFNAWYGDHQALHNLSLNIPRHQVTAFIGPSGCGKSTLLKWMNRMNDIVPSARAEGTLRIDDLDILSPNTDTVALRRKIGIVFQKPNPFPKSIYDNVAFGPRLHMKLTKSELDELVQWSLEKAAVWNEVKDRLHRPALGLSGGQQQRLCIARAIAVGPEILLMDEPCSALDPASTLAIEDLIYELRQQYTIVIVTHNMHQASRCSNRTAFFYQGTLIEAGDTEQIFTRPKQKQTEDYVSGKFG